MSRMRAFVVTRYGPPDVVVERDLPFPVPQQGQLLVRVHACTVSSGDARIRGLNVPRAAMARIAGSGRGFYSFLFHHIYDGPGVRYLGRRGQSPRRAAETKAAA